MVNGRGSEQAPNAIRLRNGRACLGLGPWNRPGSWPCSRLASRNNIRCASRTLRVPRDLGSLSGMVQPKVESRMILARVRRSRAVERNGYDSRSLPSVCFGRTRGENEMFKKLSVSAFALLVLANEVYAQAPTTPGTPAAPGTAPSTPPASTADDGSGIGWLLPLIALLVIAGLIWYFMKGRNRTSTTSAGTSTLSGTTATGTTGTTGTGGITGTAGTTTGASTSGDPSIRVYDDKKK
jgi:hypothetical protein